MLCIFLLYGRRLLWFVLRHRVQECRDSGFYGYRAERFRLSLQFPTLTNDCLRLPPRQIL